MNKKALLEQFTKWNVDGESEKVVAAVISLPEEFLDADILYALAESYLKIEQSKKAVAVLDGLRKTEENTYKWQYMMGHALLITLKEDEECSEDEELRMAILRRIRGCFFRGMRMDPPEPYIIEAKNILRYVEKLLLSDGDDEYGDSDDFDDLGDFGDFDDFDDFGDFDDEEDDLETPDGCDGMNTIFGGKIEFYDEDESEAIEEHIAEYFGEFPTVFHEIASRDIHVDIAVIPPTEERNYYTLVTMGMGAHKMALTEGVDDEFARAELVISLPPDWKVGERDEKWYWPTGLIKSLAHLPIENDTWLGWGHSVDNNGNPYAGNVGFSGVMLAEVQDVEDGADKCVLPNGDVVNFYQVIPLYREEMQFKVEHDADEIIDRLAQAANHIVDINRPNVCKDYCRKEIHYDTVERHSSKIRRKHLPLDPICGCNHIAVFIRWCIEHHIIEPSFYEHCSDVADNVFSGKDVDLRRFVIDVMNGKIEIYHFSHLGSNFVDNYYNNENKGKYSYLGDVDEYAKSYFGAERYNSEEFKGEAYLFLPFDENYYQAMSKYIQRAYDDYYKYFFFVKKTGAERIALALSKFFDFEAQPVLPETDLSDKVKNGLPERNDGKSDVSMIMYCHVLYDTAEKAEGALLNSLMPFLVMYLLVTLPYSDPMRWVEKFFTRTNDRLQIPETYAKIYEAYGQYPMLLTCDMQKSDRFTLFVRDPDGAIVHYELKDEYIG